MPIKGRDPRVRARVGSYMTDGIRLVRVLEADYTGALLEDQRTYEYISVEPIDLMQKWRPVKPMEEAA